MDPLDPTLVNGLRLGFGILVFTAFEQDTGNLVDQRHAPLLRGERHGATRRQHGAPAEPFRTLTLGVERPHAGKVNLPYAGQQVADKPAYLLFHRITIHFFFFFDVAAGAFGAGAGTVSGCVTPRQII